VDGGFVITWKELLIGGIIVLAIYIAELLLWMRGGPGRASGKELTALRARVGELERRLAALDGSEPEHTADLAPATPYGKAFTLARQGVDAARLAANCGISRAEAELIVAMQREQK
jgi:hypothetical protein